MNIRQKRLNKAKNKALEIARRLFRDGSFSVNRPRLLGKNHNTTPTRIEAHAIHLLQRAGILSKAIRSTGFCKCGWCRSKGYNINQRKIKKFIEDSE